MRHDCHCHPKQAPRASVALAVEHVAQHPPASEWRAGQTLVPVQVVQNNLGRASVGTTSMYLTTERDERMKAMRGFCKTRG